MSYVILRTDQGGGYVATIHPNATRGGSYTNQLQHARTWPSREAANAERCPGNEVVLSLEEAMR